MNALKLAEKRHSSREYKHKKLTDEDRRYVNDLLLNIPKINNANVEFSFVEDGWDLAPQMEGLAGYFGHMITAPHYFALLCEEGETCHKWVGYLGEWFILNALKQSIGSCWIEVKDVPAVKQLLQIDSPKTIAALIAFGYPKKEFHSSSLYSPSHPNSLSSLTDLGYPNIEAISNEGPISSRKAITEFVDHLKYGDKASLEELEQLGLHRAFFYMRLAPSYHNRQPWHFVVHGHAIDLIVETSEDIPRVIQGIDAGIAMLYFQVGLNDAGFGGNWHTDQLEVDYELPQNKRVVAKWVYV